MPAPVRLPTSRSISRCTAKPIISRRKSAAWLYTLDHDVRIVFEATSGCDGELIAALAARGHPFSRVDSRPAREFARASGTLAKTDRVDARVLAQMGAALDLPATIPLSPTRARLADFLRLRRQLADMRKAEKLHRHSAGQLDIAQAIEAMIDLLDQPITALDRQIAGFIAEDYALAERTRLLAAFPGIRLAGLAPHARESGTWRGARRPWGDRRKGGQAIYIAALNASRRIPVLTAMRDRMRAKDKTPKTSLNAMIRKRQPIALG